MRLLTRIKRLRPPHRYLFAFILLGWVIFFVIFSNYTQRKGKIGDADKSVVVSDGRTANVNYYTRDVRWLVKPKQLKRNYKVRKKILLVTRTRPPHERFRLFHVLCKLLDGFRSSYEVTRVEERAFLEIKNALRPNVINGRYAVIVFVDVMIYLNLKENVKEYINAYSRKFNTGILFFSTNYNGFMQEFDLNARKPLKEKGPLYHRVNSTSSLLRITRDGPPVEKPRASKGMSSTKWMYLSYDPVLTSYETVSYVLPGPRSKKRRSVRSAPFERATVILDPGKRDGIRRVFFSAGFPFFLSTMIFMDSLDYLAPMTLMYSLERYLQVDIDDIFIGTPGIRIQRKDVTDLLTVQSMLEQKVPGFKFNLGFSGKGYKRGTYEEDDGDDAILQYAHHFTWFGHLYDHEQAHKFSLKDLIKSMKRNRKFAKDHGIPLNTSYAVAPHHSGVYPVHEALYTAWRRVHRVTVTSTEEYPHLKPAWFRRGFIYRGIKVLPRQTCGLFTSTNTFKQVKGGIRALDRSIHGGELFETLLRNPITIIMTHMTNYASDRLAQYLITSLVNFVETWTNIELRSAPPTQLADMYFNLFPQDKSPLWLSPCDDPKRHLVIWDKSKSCKKFPSFLLIGPPHGGLELLQSLLHLNPDVLQMPNRSSETEFFSGENYMRGIDWYMDQFSTPSSPNQMTYEPSMSYFTSSVAPRRANALLKGTKIVFVLEDPVVIAYAHYQHLKRHNKVVDSNFDELVTSSTTPELERTRQSILRPGHFAEHIGRWMKFFDPKQMLIVNLRDLVSLPIAVMRDLQDFLALDHPLDYSKHLRFNDTLKTFCHVLANNGTGSCYTSESPAPKSDLDESTIKYLQRYYAKHNHNLVRINQKIQFKLPKWLKDIGK